MTKKKQKLTENGLTPELEAEILERVEEIVNNPGCLRRMSPEMFEFKSEDYMDGYRAGYRKGHDNGYLEASMEAL